MEFKGTLDVWFCIGFVDGTSVLFKGLNGGISKEFLGPGALIIELCASFCSEELFEPGLIVGSGRFSSWNLWEKYTIYTPKHENNPGFESSGNKNRFDSEHKQNWYL